MSANLYSVKPLRPVIPSKPSAIKVEDAPKPTPLGRLKKGSVSSRSAPNLYENAEAVKTHLGLNAQPNRNLFQGPKVPKIISKVIKAKKYTEGLFSITTGIGVTTHRSIGSYELQHMNVLIY